MSMENTARADADRPTATTQPLGFARPALVLAAWFGLIGGYLDVLMIILKKDAFQASMYYNQGRHFPWVVPLANVAILMAAGVIVVAAARLRPGLISLRAAAWLFASLALWEPMLRTPVAGVGSLVLVAGLGRWISLPFAAGPPGVRRFTNRGLVALSAILGSSMAVSLGWESIAESRAEASLPSPPGGAKNVLLLVLDTVRAESLGLHGYARDTTPNLARWAKKGVRFDRAISTAPWTLPSHGSIFTGEWPYKLNLHWQNALEPTTPTLAEFLGSRGYRTGGFASNTNFCSYESGLNRGFVHYEDYPITPRAILGSNVLGRWVVREILDRGDFYGHKWLLFQSRGAKAINRAFLDWLPREGRGGRPFFAFLNYLDAHEPFVLPEDSGPHFGARPGSPEDFAMLMDYGEIDKINLGARDVALARDSYDDCIAYLDRQVGSLLDELERRDVLQDTVVLITSDHGEEFGEHGVFNHGYTLYQQAVHVPLVVISPTTAAPPGRVVDRAVSLRDLPATVVDLVGLSAGSPFPGRSLADLWRTAAGPELPPTSPALSEVSAPLVLDPRHGRGPGPRGFAMSLVAGGRHFIRDSFGKEALYDLDADPKQLRDAGFSPESLDAMGRLRASIHQVLTSDPARVGMSVLYLGRFAKSLETRIGGPIRRDSPESPGVGPSTGTGGIGTASVISRNRASPGAGPDSR